MICVAAILLICSDDVWAGRLCLFRCRRCGCTVSCGATSTHPTEADDTAQSAGDGFEAGRKQGYDEGLAAGQAATKQLQDDLEKANDELARVNTALTRTTDQLQQANAQLAAANAKVAELEAEVERLKGTPPPMPPMPPVPAGPKGEQDTPFVPLQGTPPGDGAALPGDDAELFVSAVPGMRLWSDDTGQYQVRARLVEVFAEQIRLEKENGAFATVPLTRLSEKDRLFVEDFEQRKLALSELYRTLVAR